MESARVNRIRGYNDLARQLPKSGGQVVTRGSEFRIEAGFLTEALEWIRSFFYASPEVELGLSITKDLTHILAKLGRQVKDLAKFAESEDRGLLARTQQIGHAAQKIATKMSVLKGIDDLFDSRLVGLSKKELESFVRSGRWNVSAELREVVRGTERSLKAQAEGLGQATTKEEKRKAVEAGLALIVLAEAMSTSTSYALNGVDEKWRNQFFSEAAAFFDQDAKDLERSLSQLETMNDSESVAKSIGEIQDDLIWMALLQTQIEDSHSDAALFLEASEAKLDAFLGSAQKCVEAIQESAVLAVDPAEEGLKMAKADLDGAYAAAIKAAEDTVVNARVALQQISTGGPAAVIKREKDVIATYPEGSPHLRAMLSVQFATLVEEPDLVYALITACTNRVGMGRVDPKTVTVTDWARYYRTGKAALKADASLWNQAFFSALQIRGALKTQEDSHGANQKASREAAEAMLGRAQADLERLKSYPRLLSERPGTPEDGRRIERELRAIYQGPGGDRLRRAAQNRSAAESAYNRAKLGVRASEAASLAVGKTQA